MSEACPTCGQALPEQGVDRSAYFDAIAPNPYRELVKPDGVRIEIFTRRAVFERDGWVCRLCGYDIDPRLPDRHPMAAEIDHVVPIARGGDHALDNVQSVHRICNLAKGASWQQREVETAAPSKRRVPALGTKSNELASPKEKPPQKKGSSTDHFIQVCMQCGRINPETKGSRCKLCGGIVERRRAGAKIRVAGKPRTIGSRRKNQERGITLPAKRRKRRSR